MCIYNLVGHLIVFLIELNVFYFYRRILVVFGRIDQLKIHNIKNNLESK